MEMSDVRKQLYPNSFRSRDGSVMDQLANNSALMFRTPMEKLFLVKAASAGGFQLRNVSHNQNAKLLLYHNVYNAILGGKMKGLHLVQRIHVERIFQGDQTGMVEVLDKLAMIVGAETM